MGQDSKLCMPPLLISALLVSILVSRTLAGRKFMQAGSFTILLSNPNPNPKINPLTFQGVSLVGRERLESFLWRLQATRSVLSLKTSQRSIYIGWGCCANRLVVMSFTILVHGVQGFIQDFYLGGGKLFFFYQLNRACGC